MKKLRSNFDFIDVLLSSVLYTARLSGGVPGFLLWIRGIKKSGYEQTKKQEVIFYFLAFPFLSSFCICDFNSYLIRSKKGGMNDLKKLRSNFDLILGRSPTAVGGRI